MAQTWPANVPSSIIYDSYRESPGDNVIVTKMDVGPPKTRRRSTAAVRPIRGKIYMTETELSNFDSFYVNTLASGSLTFDLNHPRTGVSQEWIFSSIPIYRKIGGDYWSVLIEMEQMP